MYVVLALLTFVISALLVVAPPVGVWRSIPVAAAASRGWPRVVLALIGPSVAAYAVVVLMGLAGYAGQCGGWLGETRPCSGLGQYASETMFWAGMAMAVPGLLGVLLGIAVLVFRLIRRGR